MTPTDITLLRQVAMLDGLPNGAYNIRKNGKMLSRNSTAGIQIISKPDGLDVHIRPGTRGESVSIPVIITDAGLIEAVHNDFYIGENCDIDIIAGCGIHNDGSEKSQHDGVHRFYIGTDAQVRYVENHYGQGSGTGERVMNPNTEVYLQEGASIRMETTQIRGVDSTIRHTSVFAAKNSEVILTEKLLTHGKQTAKSEMDVRLEGEGSSARIISRSVAQDSSEQVFYPWITGYARCFGHVQCDAILMGKAKICSVPAITAVHPEAQLIHEAAIGRIAEEQLLKLMTLGLTEQEAEEKILSGFLS